MALLIGGERREGRVVRGIVEEDRLRVRDAPGDQRVVVREPGRGDRACLTLL